jgi:hypothetical protein
LTAQVEAYIDRSAPKEDAIGIVVPHAGLIYSGPVAGAVYSSIRFPKTFLMLGPNHTGIGARISLMAEGEWEIPTGRIEIDRRLASRIALNVPNVEKDFQAHLFEHSLEVQLPFFPLFSKDVKIVPVALLSATLDDCLQLAQGLAGVLKNIDYPVVILASSDMSHYLPERVARQKDAMAIEKILALDAEGLYETVTRERISMCGYLPVTVMLQTARLLGAKEGRLIKYATSGDVSGDRESVVGYSGIVVR